VIFQCAPSCKVLPQRSQLVTHALARGSADHIVAVECSSERDGGEEVLLELITEFAKFVQSEVVEFDAFLKSEADGIADFLVRGAEWNSLVDEIGCGGHCIEVARLRGFIHTLAIELEGCGETRHEVEHCGHEFDGKSRLLSLLHVFIVGQGQPFELQCDGLRSSMDTADFCADELGEIGILLLRHGAGAGGEGFRQRDEVEFRGGEEGDFFSETAQVQTHEC